jgi:2-polyprenyl-3-methyl-5-hydroxy-6-metoxy-1,4-benzoquinol methylase
MSLFVFPPINLYTDESRSMYSGYRSYSHYNYLRPGIIQKLKRGRFERALTLAKPYFHSGAALDMGCADGIFLPSLAAYFGRVVGVDTDPKLEIATALVATMPTSGVSLICNAGLSFEALRERIGNKFRVAFALEILEHVGSLPRLYETKADFVEGILSLLQPDGIIIASVPRMVGMGFLIKYLIQVGFHMPTEKIGIGDLLRASFFKDTARLEPRWSGAHIGFNHLLLTRALRARFDVQVSGTLTSVFYTIRRRRS